MLFSLTLSSPSSRHRHSLFDQKDSREGHHVGEAGAGRDTAGQCSVCQPRPEEPGSGGLHDGNLFLICVVDGGINYLTPVDLVYRMQRWFDLYTNVVVTSPVIDPAGAPGIQSQR